MNALLLKAGQLIGIIGIALMAVSVVVRLGGSYTVGGYATSTLLLAGVGAVSAGCFALLWVLAARGHE